MSKTYRHLAEKTPKPRDIKRQRQRQAMVHPGRAAWHAVLLPEPDAPVWKPLG